MTDGDTGTTRRALLAGTAAAGLAVAGCGRADGSATPTPAPTGTGPTAPALSTPATGGSGAGGTVLGPVADVPVGGGTVFASREVVVTRPSVGELVGLSAVCTHRACLVDTVAGGLIRCPCHGSRYALDGSVAAGPARNPLAARPVRVEHGQVVLA